jgi:hypothetical protein
MIPVFQDILDPVNGNCFAASIASILEIPLHRVPNFCRVSNPSWLEETQHFLRPMGLSFLDVQIMPENRGWVLENWTYHTIAGKGPRGAMHSVVAYRGKIVHDPYPGSPGLDLDQDKEWWFGTFVALSPAKMQTPEDETPKPVCTSSEAEANCPHWRAALDAAEEEFTMDWKKTL